MTQLSSDCSWTEATHTSAWKLHRPLLARLITSVTLQAAALSSSLTKLVSKCLLPKPQTLPPNSTLSGNSSNTEHVGIVSIRYYTHMCIRTYIFVCYYLLWSYIRGSGQKSIGKGITRWYTMYMWKNIPAYIAYRIYQN